MNQEAVSMKTDGDLHGFNYFYDGLIEPKSSIIIKMPRPTPNKRGVNDIGFAFRGDVKVYGTISKSYAGDNVVWVEIEPFNDVNKTITYLKLENTGESAAVINVRAILN